MIGAPALAAELPLKAPPPPAATWTGCYVNGGGGYGMWNQDHYTEVYSLSSPSTYIPISETATTGGRGWLGTVGAGCDYQFNRFNSNFVIGVFGDYDFMNLEGAFESGIGFFNGNENESGAWAIGGRIGYLVTPKLLTYFNGGYTQTRFDQINLGLLIPSSPSANLNIPAHTYDGWFIGGGYEYALWDIVPIHGLFWRTEYRFADYQAADLPGITTSTGLRACGRGDLVTYNADFSSCAAEHMEKYVQTITSGLVWRFNWAGPIVARD